MKKKTTPLSDQPAPWSELLKPKHWPTWLGVGLLYLISCLPYRFQLAIGHGIGKLMYYCIPKRRHIAAVNINLCFPEKSDEERVQLIKKTFLSVGMAIIETGIAWFWSEKKLRKLIHYENFQPLHHLSQQGKGALLLGGHYTSLDIAGRLYGILYPAYVVAREQNNLVIDALLKRKRNLSQLKVIHRHDIRGIVNALKKGHSVWYAPDQDYGAKYSMFVPFFNISTATITALVRIAAMANVPVLPVSYFRCEKGKGYDLMCEAPLENFPSGDMEYDLTRMNQVLERIIRQYPEQYLWLHRRFKSRPVGEKSFYE